MVDERVAEKVIRSMACLNKSAAEVVQETGASAYTDVAGFGLLGHAFEMIQGTG